MDHTSPASHSFTVGRFTCIAINDGTFFYTAAQYFANAPADVLTPALAEYGLQREHIPSPYTCMVVDTGAELVVVDTGADRVVMQRLLPAGVAIDVGRFPESLAAAGVDPRDVDRVVITHAHPDHIGGNADATGAARFPNARIVMFREEWEYWTSERTLADQSPIFTDPVRTHLLPLADRVDLLDGECDVVPGVRALPAPGHTPGHMALAVQSEGEELLYVSDAALHPLHLTHPDWYTVFELDAPQSLESRRILFERAAASGALVLAFHFDPFPSLGRVHPAATGWTWHPVGSGP